MKVVAIYIIILAAGIALISIFVPDKPRDIDQRRVEAYKEALEECIKMAPQKASKIGYSGRNGCYYEVDNHSTF